MRRAIGRMPKISSLIVMCGAVRAFRQLPMVMSAGQTDRQSLMFSALLGKTPTANDASCTEDDEGTAKIDNPLLKQQGCPLFGEITPEHVKPALEHLLEKFTKEKASFEEVLNDPLSSDSWGSSRMPYEFNEVMGSYEKLKSPLEYAWGVVNHLDGVKNSEGLRVAKEAMQGPMVEAFSSLGQSRPFYKALKGLLLPGNMRNLDEPQKRILESAERSMRHSGVDLEGKEKERYNEIILRLAQLSNQFSNNVLDATKEFSLVLTTKEEIKGLPETALAYAAMQARSSGVDENATPENGPWKLTLDMPSYIPSMEYLESSSIREKLYKAFITRGSKAGKDNQEIISEILTLRKEMSALLGFSNYAELSLASKMAPSVEAVNSLTKMLIEKGKPFAMQEISDLKQFAGTDVKHWDVSYWSNKLKEARFGFSDEQLRPYFALPNVLDGLFSLCGRIFGIKVEVSDDPSTQKWHPDVTFYDVKDAETDEHIASFFLDPYARPEEKRGGAWMDVCLGKSNVLNRKPVAYLTCNGSPPVDNKPSLMTFRDVETLFHEFGHGLQHMLTTVPYSEAAGINNVEWDAVELPSQFMENWCYHKETLYSFAKHYETGEPLPEDLFMKLKAQKNFMAGNMLLRQLYLGQVDLDLHSVYNPEDPELTVNDFDHKIANDILAIPPLSEARQMCSFSHIFAGGYAAGYYSYKWAEVMSADAFAAFEEKGLEDDTQLKEVGRSFRQTVLSLGGGKDPMEVFKTFRGREPTPDALLRHSGLVKA